MYELDQWNPHPTYAKGKTSIEEKEERVWW
jgi:hypothetical protein